MFIFSTSVKQIYTWKGAKNNFVTKTEINSYIEEKKMKQILKKKTNDNIEACVKLWWKGTTATIWDLKFMVFMITLCCGESMEDQSIGIRTLHVLSLFSAYKYLKELMQRLSLFGPFIVFFSPTVFNSFNFQYLSGMKKCIKCSN